MGLEHREHYKGGLQGLGAGRRRDRLKRIGSKGMEHRKFGIGQPIRRVEDARFVTGAGRYTDDFAPEGCAYAAVLRSPQAHARFRFGDLEVARALPGVPSDPHACRLADLGSIPCLGTVVNAARL
jgi:carbon-monoxide dehydrogenase large subunit